MTARFPQNGCHMQLRARTWKCAGEAPRPFDLCLELIGEHMTARYYSRSEWIVRPRATLDEEIAWMANALPPLGVEDEGGDDGDARAGADDESKRDSPALCPMLGPN